MYCAPNSPQCNTLLGGQLKDLVGNANGYNVLTCPTPTTCALKAQALLNFFPKGVALKDCVYGECIPEAWDTIERMGYSGTGQNVTCIYTRPTTTTTATASANNKSKTSASILSIGRSALLFSTSLALLAFS